MTIELEANYSKKSVRQTTAAISCRARSSQSRHINQVQTEANRLYSLLQSNVDRFSRLDSYRKATDHRTETEIMPSRKNEMWVCTPKRKDLVLDIVDENKLDKNEIEKLAQDRFSTSVKQLSTLLSSGLIK